MIAKVSVILAALALAAPATGQASTALGKSRKLGPPVRYGNLTVFPIYDSSARSRGRYMTMDEGLKARSLKVREKQGGGQVSSVLVTNLGRKPVYLMSGEVILGGQQDRIIGDDMIVPPLAKNLPVRVYCVEHGRWSGRREFDETARAIAVPSLRNTAQEGAFMAAVAASPAPRSAASGSAVSVMAQRTASSAQDEVWQKVAAKNKAFGAAPATGSYRDVVNSSEGRAARGIKPYLSALNARFPKHPRLVGAVAAVNGKVMAADIFGDPELFRKLWPKLLRSYAAEAAESGASGPTAKPIASGEARRFVLETTGSGQKSENRAAGGINRRYEAGDARAYHLMDRAQNAGAGSPVHESVMRK